MEVYNELFLQALRAALKGEKVQWDMEIAREDWLALMEQAQVHNVLPMIYEAVYSCPAASRIDTGLMEIYKKRMLCLVMKQAMKTSEFLKLQKYLREAGLTPVVVKGIVCRSLYPKSDYRISADEDILIPKDQFNTCHQKMLQYGMHLLKDQDIEEAFEVSYGKNNSPVYIELHKSLFSPDSEAYGEWNEYFSDAFEHVICEGIEGDTVLTMNYTEHLFYLICHSFKHFLHSGFGIRQVCDITLFANIYGCKIDWQKLLKLCKEIHAEGFAAALFKIGQKYLTFQPDTASYPELWSEIEVDETAMLADLLSSGVYGQSNMSRRHSSNITLNAVAAHKKGEKPTGNVLRLAFPKAKDLEGRYAYLKERPYLLPAAWADRLLRYKEETRRMKNNDAAESIRIGNERIELLKQYGVISENESKSGR